MGKHATKRDGSPVAGIRRDLKGSLFAVTALTSVAYVASNSFPQSNPPLLELTGLIFLTFAVFVMFGLMLLKWEKTMHLGNILISRNIDFVENWEKETLRSSTEVVVWISVINSSFHVTERLDFSVVMGTLSACLVVFLGDYMTPASKQLQKHLRTLFGESEKESISLASSSSVMVIIYGYGALTAMLTNVKDIFTGFLIAALAGVSLLFAAKVIHILPFTRRCGEIIQNRVYGASENWIEYPMRSAAELSIFLGVTGFTYATKSDLMLAIRAATISGILVCLGGELCSRVTDLRKENNSVKFVPTVVVVYAIVFTCHYIFTDIPTLAGRPISFFEQVSVSVVAALSYFIIGKIFMAIEFTSKLGEVIQSRLLSTKHNWEVHPVRSSVEVGTTNVVAWAVWYSTGSICVTLGMTLFWGPMMILFNEFVNTSEYDIAQSEAESVDVSSTKPQEASSSSSSSSSFSSPSTIPAPPKPRSTGVKKLFSLDEVRQHSSPSDMFLLIENEVYDVTEFAKTHPGGTIIYKYGGKDASDQFRAFHRPRVAGYLKKFHVGSLDPKDAPEVDPATQDYRNLRSKLWKEGYFKANPTFYNLKHCVWVALVALSVLTILTATNFYVQTLFGGACLGIGWQQAAFLAHDAAHHGIREPPPVGRTNWLAWLLGSVVFGISTNMWNEEHSMHHAITVRPREDPQFNYLPIWLIDMKELSNEKVDGKGGYKLNPFIRFLVSLQHFTFVPLILIIGRVNLHLISVGFELKNIFLSRKVKEGLTGILGMAIYWTWHLSLLSLLPDRASRVWFSVASHLSAGILHIQLLLSHLNVETMDESEEDSAGFFKFQMSVSRNIDVHWSENWFHGGLEYQIEHHLFPQLPRHELGNVKPMVRELCEKHGVLYRNDKFTDAMKGVLGNMRELAWAIVSLDQ
ncbi:hypothetical protein TrRE_jg3666 [Triparma retinervis]|uniref:Cytochrome b5 heme-binding domain-containing protein n=1 Tax=Triparma retinervis TaxID=2557542 RepID=A0A9W6ZVM9_9STRA|nr:hypothetical protein TrRE_jg3666 [Triparma retinervis]